MSVYARELSVTYGSYTVGGSSGNLLTDQVLVRDGAEEASVEFSFVVTGSTESAFAAACVAAEVAFRKRFLDLVVTQGSSTLLALKQSDNTALEMDVAIANPESEFNTGRTRLYRVTARCGRPADYVSGNDAGLRDCSVSIGYSSSRRRAITISGVYTAVGGALARAEYAAKIAAKTTAVLQAIGGTFELVAEDPTATSFHDQTLRFTRMYRELLFSQGGSGGDDPAIVEQHLHVARRRWSERNAPVGGTSTGEGGPPGSGGRAQPLVEVEAVYDCAIDATVTTGLEAKWKSIRDWIISEMTKVLAGGSFALTEDRPNFDYDENRISARMVGVGLDAGAGNVIRRESSTSDDVDLGLIFDPVWTGVATDAIVGQGPRVQLRTQVLVEDVASGHGGSASAGGAASSSSSGFSGGSLGGFGFGSGFLLPQLGGGGEYYTGIGGSTDSNVNGLISPAAASSWPYSAAQTGGGTSGDKGGGGDSGATSSNAPDTSGYRRIHQTTKTEELVIGLDGRQISITRTTTTTVTRFVTAPKFTATPAHAVTPS